jgi:hypothetical protein
MCLRPRHGRLVMLIPVRLERSRDGKRSARESDTGQLFSPHFTLHPGRPARKR